MDEVRIIYRHDVRTIDLVLIDCYVPPNLPPKVDISHDYFYLRINGLIVQGHVFARQHEFFEDTGFLLINAWDSRELTVDAVMESIQLGRTLLLVYDIERDRCGLVSRSSTGPILPIAVGEHAIVFKKVDSGVQVEYEVERSRISWLAAERSSQRFLIS